ncbi:putative ATP-dependent zinc metallopeptidase, putative,metallo-peptidase, clan MA(E), family M41 [Trypanosoma grayi]|uniref:putative ATP-dependent zinc metallopeptidase, putative,metallo-peptidase, clan MA(E), family M41 n=1 Tax=Trypanosoma grayi TaxID=71804 RepID=UPI0004F41CEB|nr:putative ATP-dependent zinc metallopeptidase, putative,metallo-peptidase, clan MA(E), family M41 [Trypanosoma grayi]KEG07869.1 putative ATP-dependent zinc metallopeptidase, putative,metallo-peptidase, clan MA(E), family M41 [Trypanosoma grayi]
MTENKGSEYDRGVQEARRHRARTEDNWLRASLGPLLWFGVPFAVAWALLRRQGPTGNSSNPFEGMMEQMMPIKKRQFRVDVKGTKFNDVIGIPEAKMEVRQYVDFLRSPNKFTRLGARLPEAKMEVRQYVDFLRSPNKFTRLGARLPRGCLLTGEPGTGKTLLAKAVAGEADVPFFSCSGSDFIELMGGSGPKRVRELFEEARSAAPAIVFIDEIDAIGSRAGKQGGSVSSEENRTINQLLAELDGLSTGSDAVIVMAATNFQDNIDKALLREGRFDRKVNIEMPDKAARVEIFKHYLSRVGTGDPNGRIVDEDGLKLPVSDSISNLNLATELADLTPGISPATIAAIVNEAALQSGIREKKLVEKEAILEAIDNTLVGRKHRNRQSEASLRRTAIHEVGHALTAWMLPTVKKVMKVSVVPRGKAQGYTQRAGSEYHEYQTNATLFADMVVMLGGRAAEETLLGDPSAGAMDDLQRATDIALKKMMVFGMDAGAGLLSYHPESTQAGRIFVSFSNTAQHIAEEEAMKLVSLAHKVAVEIIKANTTKIETATAELMTKKEIMTADLERLWGGRPLTPTVDQLVEKLMVLQQPPQKQEATPDTC